MTRIMVRDMTVIAIFAALTAILSQIAIPIGVVSINLAMLAVFLAGGLLGAKKAAISQLIYIACGAIGMPVFVGFNAGIGALVGPTGGYIVGYVAAALLVGFLSQKWHHRLHLSIFAMLIGLVACYTLGTAWFMLVMRTNLTSALATCVLPFLPLDFVKIALAALLVKRLRKLVKI